VNCGPLSVPVLEKIALESDRRSPPSIFPPPHTEDLQIRPPPATLHIAVHGRFERRSATPYCRRRRRLLVLRPVTSTVVLSCAWSHCPSARTSKHSTTQGTLAIHRASSLRRLPSLICLLQETRTWSFRPLDEVSPAHIIAAASPAVSVLRPLLHDPPSFRSGTLHFCHTNIGYSTSRIESEPDHRTLPLTLSNNLHTIPTRFADTFSTRAS
jgi:hypothetical protein